MIVVAIVGILAAVALPAYDRYVQSSNRAVAKTDLLELAQFLERNFTVNSQYPTANASLAFRNSPRDAVGSDVRYTIAFSAASTASFTLTATPANGQVGDECGTLNVNNFGQTSGALATCW